MEAFDKKSFFFFTTEHGHFSILIISLDTLKSMGPSSKYSVVSLNMNCYALQYVITNKDL